MLLAISTSQRTGSVALYDIQNPKAVGTMSWETPHAETIFGAIDRLLEELGLDLECLAALAADIGPGSFTGTRVGVSVARGIAWARDLPLVPVSSLEALLASGSEGSRSAAIDAGRGEAFVLAHAEGEIERWPLAALTEMNGLVVDPALRALVPGATVSQVTAELVGRLAIGRISGGLRGAALHRLEPTYARLPDAQLLIKNK